MGSSLPAARILRSHAKIGSASNTNCVARYKLISVCLAKSFFCLMAKAQSCGLMSGLPSGWPARPIFKIPYFSNKPVCNTSIEDANSPTGVLTPPPINNPSVTPVSPCSVARFSSKKWAEGIDRAAKCGTGLKPSSFNRRTLFTVSAKSDPGRKVTYTVQPGRNSCLKSATLAAPPGVTSTVVFCIKSIIACFSVTAFSAISTSPQNKMSCVINYSAMPPAAINTAKRSSV